VRIKNIVHKGLRRLVEHDDAAAVPAAVALKLRRMVSFLQEMSLEEELRAIPTWKAHQLTGDRQKRWSLFVTKNWRLTFRIDLTEDEIVDLNFEDYH
jgi:toxin HigB-1